MSNKDRGDDPEPDWMNPANDRKTPYTDEEIEAFVEGFILGLDDLQWESMKLELGEKEARERIKARIVKMDERNLINISPKGLIQ